MKAESLGNDTIAQKILSLSNPSHQKSLGRTIKDDPTWYDSARDIIYPGILAKFKQNNNLAKYLLDTGTKNVGRGYV